MKVPLAKIETLFDEALTYRASQMVQFHQVSALEKVEDNLFVGQINDADKSYEVEILCVGSRAVQYTCECDDFAEHNICAHLVAAFFELRDKYMPGYGPSPRPKITTTSTPQKMTINWIVNHIPNEAISAFIKDYARKNKGFSLNMKSAFIPMFPAVNVMDKYTNHFQALERSCAKKGKLVSASCANSLLQHLDLLLSSAERLLFEKEYEEVLGISYHVISLTGNIVPRIKGEVNSFLAYAERAFHLIHKVCKSLASPALLLQVGELLQPLLFGFLAKRRRFSWMLLQILYELSLKFTGEEAFYELLETLSRRNLNSRQQAALITIQMVLDPEKALPTDLSPEVLLETADLLLDAQATDQAVAVLETPTLLLEGSWHKKEAIRKRIQIRLSQAHDLRLLEDIKEEVFTSFDQEFLFNLKPALGAYWGACVDYLIRSLSSKKSARSVAFMAALLMEQGMESALFELLEQEGTLHSTMQYLPYLTTKFPDRAESLLVWQVKQFIDTHFGKQAAETVQRILFRLEKDELFQLRNSLIKFVSRTYKSRKYLLEIIQN